MRKKEARFDFYPPRLLFRALPMRERMFIPHSLNGGAMIRNFTQPRTQTNFIELKSSVMVAATST
jgi:hypothetical protein